ncbi:hypothetical protein FHR81_002075 [Actinoalloteichus hoggarensis]|uniref:Glucans biosynthesis protein n=1 Tax=Actinoalloteichus hoggarensis TaxID=1470176 RepID=A0A221W5J0_9PSEU|nr:acyltransferase [Actinoalloteichus hoggarensis]ASO21108.1 glucans biosynthesis protein [Actinoalloteichus hoggarensis]MBB5921037.1 hypothetical protein [Actinoalloteichus hoggarensis]
MTYTAPSQPTPIATRPRLAYLDNLRVALTVLVVVHHAAAGYSGIPGVWYHTEPATDGSAGFLAGLVMVNQGFFMGAFFLIAGVFVPGSYDRKGGRRFIIDRLIRLGIPLLVFVVAIRPLVNYGYYVSAREAVLAQEGVELPYWLFYLFSWDPGPMWFVELLLLFSLCYVLVRRLRRGRRPAAEPRREGRAPGALLVIGLAVAVAVATYLWRIVVPVGTTVPILGLPTVAYLPQYAALFVVGVLAARNGWLPSLSATAGRIGFAVAVVAAAGVVLVFRSTGDAFHGLGSPESLLMAVCESALAVGMTLGLLVLFRNRFDRQTRTGGFLSERAYTVYFTHALVLVGLGVALSGLAAPAVVKFLLLAVTGVPLCWLAAHLVLALPGARKVL